MGLFSKQDVVIFKESGDAMQYLFPLEEPSSIYNEYLYDRINN